MWDEVGMDISGQNFYGFLKKSPTNRGSIKLLHCGTDYWH
jgi:hypothetical protein